MTLLRIPKPRQGIITKNWRGISKGENDLDFYSSYCLDFDKVPGMVVVSEPMKEIFDDVDDAQIGIIEAIIRTDQLRTSGQAARDAWWIMSGARWFNSISITERNLADTDFTLAEESETNNPTDAQDDALMFGNALISPSATDLDRKPAATSAWTNPWYTTLTGASALTSNPHPLDIFLNKLLIGDGNFLNTVDDSSVVNDPMLTFPNEFRVNKIVHNTDLVFIACNNLGGQNAMVFAWDGISKVYNNYWSLGSRTVLAGTVINGVPIFLNHIGQLEAFNGNGFDIIAEFPCSKEVGRFTNLDAEWVHRNGMVPFEDGIAIAVVGDLTYKRFPSGIWYLNLKNDNFYPRFGFKQSASVVDSSFGMQYISLVGALINAGRGNGPLACGARIRTSSSALRWGLHVTNTDSDAAARTNRGYFITSILSSKEATAKWMRLKAKFNEFLDSDDTIIIKYKIREAPTDDFVFDSNAGNVDTAVITWASTTTFTAVLATGRAVGDDVEIIGGANAGLFTRITALSATPDGSSTITVTIAETAAAASGTGWGRFDNFILLGTITDNDIQEKLYSIIKQNHWIQFKVEMRSGTVINDSPKLRELLVEFNEYSK